MTESNFFILAFFVVYTDFSAVSVRVRAIRYQADLSYEVRARYWLDKWVIVVEDVKSRATKTRVYAMKKKLMLEKFGIEIREI